MENKILNESRRTLLKKAYTAPAVIALGSMVLTTNIQGASSLSHSSKNKGNNGWGNGDQHAPGNSKKHNNAENNENGKSHKKHGNANSN